MACRLSRARNLDSGIVRPRMPDVHLAGRYAAELPIWGQNRQKGFGGHSRLGLRPMPIKGQSPFTCPRLLAQMGRLIIPMSYPCEPSAFYRILNHVRMVTLPDRITGGA